MVRHSVIFKFKQSVDSAAAQNFFTAAKKLSIISGVESFEVLRQVSKKNNYEFGLCMQFANEEVYQQYNDHPMHVQFINEYWVNYIEDFLEIDYKLMSY
jgi:Stress responsive A/B Barrel Domain.